MSIYHCTCQKTLSIGLIDQTFVTHLLGSSLKFVALVISVTCLLTLDPLELLSDVVVHVLIRLFLFPELLRIITQDNTTTSTVTIVLIIVTVSLAGIEITPGTY